MLVPSFYFQLFFSVQAPELYSRIVACLDARSWSLNGETLPSRLGQYCESAFAPGSAMAPALQGEAAQVGLKKWRIYARVRLLFNGEDDD